MVVKLRLRQSGAGPDRQGPEARAASRSPPPASSPFDVPLVAAADVPEAGMLGRFTGSARLSDLGARPERRPLRHLRGRRGRRQEHAAGAAGRAAAGGRCRRGDDARAGRHARGPRRSVPLVVQGAADRWAPSTELLLLTAARDDHVRRVIQPALAAGSWVLCDRFIDSTRVYQGIAGGLGVERVDRLHELRAAGASARPDAAARPRSARRPRPRAAPTGAESRFESKGADFHRAGSRRLSPSGRCRARPVRRDRCRAGVAAVVADAVWAVVRERLPVSG